jgi:hypothetical protein
MALSEAIIATYMTIHMARSPRFTPIPPVHTVRELRLLARSSGRERKSCGCGFQATKARVRLSDEPILLAKGIVMQASRSPVREHRDSILRHIVREREWTTRISVRTLPPWGPRGAPGARHDATERTHKRRRKHGLKAKSRRVLGVRSALPGQRYARLELKGPIGVVVVGWDWGTREWAKSSTLLSCGAAFGTVL